MAKKTMTMEDWAKRIDIVLEDAGQVTAEYAKKL